jgi:hypothetical protein
MHISKLIELEDPSSFKVHLASWSGRNEPLDVFVRDRAEWGRWNSWRAGKDDFNRRYIFSLIDFVPEPGVWLFGGIYEVLSRDSTNHAHSYEVQLTDMGAELIGRLKIAFSRPGRGKSIKLEKYLDHMVVSELLKDPYTGEPFPGYEDINHGFAALETIFKTNRADWKAALLSVKGVYVIFDKSNGKKYVGSAYGGTGIWSRWSTYIGTGHGHNDELSKLIEVNGIDYARINFTMCLLEYRPAKTDDQTIIDREVFWKEALLSRGEFGYNKN